MRGVGEFNYSHFIAACTSQEGKEEEEEEAPPSISINYSQSYSEIAKVCFMSRG